MNIGVYKCCLWKASLYGHDGHKMDPLFCGTQDRSDSYIDLYTVWMKSQDLVRVMLKDP